MDNPFESYLKSNQVDKILVKEVIDLWEKAGKPISLIDISKGLSYYPLLETKNRQYLENVIQKDLSELRHRKMLTFLMRALTLRLINSKLKFPWEINDLANLIWKKIIENPLSSFGAEDAFHCLLKMEYSINSKVFKNWWLENVLFRNKFYLGLTALQAFLGCSKDKNFSDFKLPWTKKAINKLKNWLSMKSDEIDDYLARKIVPYDEHKALSIKEKKQICSQKEIQFANRPTTITLDSYSILKKYYSNILYVQE